MLARYGALLEPIARPVRTETQNQLAELVAARRSLLRDRTATPNRVQASTIELFKRDAQHRLRQIEAQATSLDAVKTVIVDDPILIRRREILLSIPGLGYVTAQALFADMPELGTMDKSQVGAALAPVTRQSGKWHGTSFIRGRRACLRQALYMPAPIAMRFNPDLKRLYNRLVDSGKHAKLAITAVMRKLVILANASLYDDRTSIS